MTSLVAAILFAGLVVTAAAAARRRSRGAVSLLIAWSLAASFGAGLSQKDAWPFSAWPLVAGIHPATATHPRLVAVDAAGLEHAIDFRAWEPLGTDELHAWLKRAFLALDPARQDEAARWLLARAESARRRALEGRRPSKRARPLGAMEAPLFLLHPAIWDDPASVPRAPFTGLRLYLETWDIEERARTGSPPERRLVFAGPAEDVPS